MKAIQQTYIINAPLEKVWHAFVDPDEIESWGAGPAEMSEEVGTKFKLWGGDIHGTNTQVVKNKKLAQDWYGGDWTEPSKVVFEFEDLEDKTKVNLTHTHVPEKEISDFDSGWKDYYLGAMKTYLERG
ncbi:MAG: hypothetical protein A3F35_01590 [Candidatus Woykebacteria bacterium RIFCSPHIGHO2_12_FULL_45_10]|uniref:Activator of Hsp90 ATPase homologue 1/2-like C-terminal domain-containing protein n=1 Tax=Candidatus Woykebacteria bacterium RIFCSPHIGHO2_12_FULL_45_10 TaxID=1802603 RepID=A0A1G1WNH1_9BACT|nr:MAG: hypothetical protein A3F35_01590 [Candidatus Woykebacteria bacterium RIFCSPHIGHO2_12_FULL_45_10]